MALKFPAAFDPDERKDYVRDWTAEMDANSDTIQDMDFVLPASALAAGLIIDFTQISVDLKKAVVWIKSNNPSLTRTLVGTEVSIQHTVTTTGGREFNETLILKIKEK